jgi:predicted NBD/HSP70 family sugar kinase
MAALLVGVGVDLGGTNIRSTVFTNENMVVAQDSRKSGFGPDEVLQNLVDSITAALSSIEAQAYQLIKIGVGAPGVIDSKSGTLNHSMNLGISDFRLIPKLNSHFGCEVHLENDVNATALGLSILNPGLGSLAYLNFGTGLAAGIVIQGKIWQGHSGLAGEVGHIPISIGQDSCHCGQKGCLELYTSWSGLKRIAIGYSDFATLAKDQPSELREKTMALFRPNAIKSILTVFLSIDPEVVFLGGGLMSHWEGGFEQLRLDWLALLAATPLLQGKNLENRLLAIPEGLPVAAIGALRA